jgi:hypothetical protein
MEKNMLTFSKFISEQKDNLVTNGNELYFAFGHNTDTEYFEKLDPPAKLLGKASVKGYRLVLEEYCDIRPKDGSVLEGVLWSLPKNREKPINKYEQYYHRTHIIVSFKGKRYKAFAFKMDSKHYDGRKPSKEYIDILRKGYKENGIPMKQLEDAIKERMNRN